MRYKLIDHTADFGIHLSGRDEKQLFRNAALIMFELMVASGSSGKCAQAHVSVSGNDWPDLMVNWLRELLYLWTGRAKILRSVTVDELTPNKISGRVTLESYQPGRHTILSEIKAVTYHKIDVFEKDDHWEAKIIFDV